MNGLDFKALSKTLSNEVLIDVVYHQRPSEAELEAYMAEIQKRGLEKDLEMMQEAKKERKAKIIDSVSLLPKEELFNIVIYNIYHYEEHELITFRNEIERRGWNQELAEASHASELSRANFRDSVINKSENAEELLDNFAEHIFATVPGMKEKIEAEQKEKSNQDLVVGALSILTGGIMLYFTDGSLLPYGAFLIGTVLIIKGVLKF